MDDDESAIYGTVGYQAPEVAEVGPSVASDLYTVARTLAVLTFDFQGYTNVFVDSLPDPENIKVFQTYESFYRLLVRATDPDPARRFASAQEMAEQLTGVLREVVALQTGRPRPALSTLFGPELRVTDTQLFAELTEDVSRLGGAGGAGLGRAGAASDGRGDGSAAVGRPRRWRPAAGARCRPAACRAAPGGPGRAAPLGVGRGTGTGAGTHGAGAMPAARGPGPRRRRASPARGAAGASGLAPQLAPLDARATSLALPVPRVDPNDPNAGFLAGLLASAPAELIAALHSAPAASPETAAARAARPAGDGRTGLRRRGARRPGERAPRRLAGRLVPRPRLAGDRGPRDRGALLRRDLRRVPRRARAEAGARASAPRCSASWTTPPSTTAWCGRPTRASSAPPSAWPGCSSRRATGPEPCGRWSRCRRRRSTTRRRGSPPYGRGCGDAPRTSR